MTVAGADIEILTTNLRRDFANLFEHGSTNFISAQSHRITNYCDVSIAPLKLARNILRNNREWCTAEGSPEKFVRRLCSVAFALRQESGGNSSSDVSCATSTCSPPFKNFEKKLKKGLSASEISTNAYPEPNQTNGETHD